MLIDLEHLGGKPETHHSDVCIAGGGVAGLVLATALADAGIYVHLLEAGGRSVEDRSQEIYAAEMAGDTHTGTTLGRFRVFGGSSVRWGGQILPFTSDIFSPDPGLLSPAWPISPASLEPFYSKIEQVLGTDSLPYTDEICESPGRPKPRAGLANNPHVNLRFSKWAPFSHRNLAHTLGAQAIASPRISVFLHANVTECLLSPNSTRAEAFIVRNYRGDRFRFKAEEHVLATGTIEATRLLLASRSVNPEGIGNSHDQVGRYVHDHVCVPVGYVRGKARAEFLDLLGGFFVGGTKRTGRIEASPLLRQHLGLLAVMAYLVVHDPADTGAFVARELFRKMHHGDLLPTLRGTYRRLPSACVEVLRLAYHEKIRKRRIFSPRAEVTLCVLTEQRPGPTRGIRLNDQSRDRLDMPVAVLDWRVSSDELGTIRRFTEFLAQEFDRIGITGIQWIPDLLVENGGSFPGLVDYYHLMGGTVMGSDPSQTVVDTDLSVHGVKNLSVASLSTFPAGGSSNPTFTLIALTLRLAERLKIAISSAASARTGEAVLTDVV